MRQATLVFLVCLLFMPSYAQAKKESICLTFKECSLLAEQGIAEAQYILGKIYYRYRGDAELAAIWLDRAAEQEYEYAQVSLASMAAFGECVPQALKWIHKLAERGVKYEQTRLGYLYNDGICVEQSYEKAAKWYRKAAERGDKEAKRRLPEAIELSKEYYTLYVKPFEFTEKEEQELKDFLSNVSSKNSESYEGEKPSHK